jgi:thioredoxin/glutathione reductase (selenoprotein)
MFVIGGGSGGISAARWACKAGKKVALADFVKPSPAGTKWGLGGTCVNVGCIPKKMMHYAALLSEARTDQQMQGWALDMKQEHNWGQMVNNVQMHIKGLNWGYKTDLMKMKAKYFNAYATFKDAHTIELTNAKGEVSEVTADKIVIATGGRPSYPGIPGDKEFGISSDDIFSLKKAPGKTLVVGASYVALECAGFLTAFGYDTTVMVRSILLRGFDQDMAEKIGFFMEKNHTKFIRGATPSKLEKPDPTGQIHVTFTHEGKEVVEQYDTVLFAVGRYAVTGTIGLENAGVTAEKNGKFKCNDVEQTNVPHIYAIGDVIYGQLELTPVAIKAGMLLANRLFAGQTEKMDYANVATTVFTPLEYGCCGPSEEECKEIYGAENIKTYHTQFQPLEWQFNKKRAGGDCYVKVLVNITNDKVVSFHILSPSAGEISQGLAVAMKCGMTKAILDSTVGIHPTIAEDTIGLKFTKEDDGDVQKSSC